MNTAPAQANAPAAGVVIGEAIKPRVRSSFPVDDNQDASSASDTAEAGPAKQTSSVTTTDSSTNPSSPAFDDSAKAQTTNESSRQQAQSQATGDTTVLTQTPGSAPNTDQSNTDHSTLPSAGLPAIASADASASSDAPSATGAAKPDIDGLPNFGFSAAAVTTPSTGTAATTSTTAVDAVPIAGLAVAIASRAQAGSNQFEIRLDPPELGRIDVHLNVDRDGQVITHMTAERADTLNLLQSQQPQLERALEQAGLKTADNGLQFSLRDQSFAGQNNGFGQQSNVARLVIPDSDIAPVDATQIYARAGLGSGVDIRV